jgi:hypothetical protein
VLALILTVGGLAVVLFWILAGRFMDVLDWIATLTVLAWLTGVGIVCFVAYHFIVKFW